MAKHSGQSYAIHPPLRILYPQQAPKTLPSVPDAPPRTCSEIVEQHPPFAHYRLHVLEIGLGMRVGVR